MRRRAIVSFIAACALSACAHQTSGPPTGLEGMDWAASNDGGEAKLAYGLPNSDVLLVMLTCQPRSGAVDIVMPDVSGKTLTLISGARSATLQATPLGDVEGIVATTKASEPVLLAFATTGALKIGAGSRVAPLPRARAGTAGAFLESCRN